LGSDRSLAQSVIPKNCHEIINPNRFGKTNSLIKGKEVPDRLTQRESLPAALAAALSDLGEGDGMNHYRLRRIAALRQTPESR
jgi:hypothetical protein